MSLPAGLNVEVHEDDAVTAHLVLPPSSRLNEADLRAVSGGRWVAQPGRDGVDAAFGVEIAYAYGFLFGSFPLVTTVLGLYGIFFAILACLPGTKGDNLFGPDPLQSSDDTA